MLMAGLFSVCKVQRSNIAVFLSAWNESRSPRGKGTEWSEETSGWSSNGNAANGGWGSGEDVPSSKWEVGTEKKHPPLSDGYYNDSGLTVSLVS